MAYYQHSEEFKKAIRQLRDAKENVLRYIGVTRFDIIVNALKHIDGLVEDAYQEITELRKNGAICQKDMNLASSLYQEYQKFKQTAEYQRLHKFPPKKIREKSVDADKTQNNFSKFATGYLMRINKRLAEQLLTFLRRICQRY